jgi:uncharacterized protein (TIGR02271 family)
MSAREESGGGAGLAIVGDSGMADSDARSLAKERDSPQSQTSSSTDRESAPPPQALPGDDETLKLLAEEISVDRHEVETCRVGVKRVTLEREEVVDVPITREQVVVERVPVGLRIDAIPAIRHDGDTIIIPVVEEVLIVERRLMLKEEFHVKRVSTTERYQERVTLRHQEAVVTRTQPEASEPETSPSSQPKVESK